MNRYVQSLGDGLPAETGSANHPVPVIIAGKAGEIPIVLAYCKHCERINTHAYHEYFYTHQSFRYWICIGCGSKRSI